MSSRVVARKLKERSTLSIDAGSITPRSTEPVPVLSKSASGTSLRSGSGGGGGGGGGSVVVSPRGIGPSSRAVTNRSYGWNTNPKVAPRTNPLPRTFNLRPSSSVASPVRSPHFRSAHLRAASVSSIGGASVGSVGGLSRPATAGSSRSGGGGGAAGSRASGIGAGGGGAGGGAGGDDSESVRGDDRTFTARGSLDSQLAAAQQQIADLKSLIVDLNREREAAAEERSTLTRVHNHNITELTTQSRAEIARLETELAAAKGGNSTPATATATAAPTGTDVSKPRSGELQRFMEETWSCALRLKEVLLENTALKQQLHEAQCALIDDKWRRQTDRVRHLAQIASQQTEHSQQQNQLINGFLPAPASIDSFDRFDAAFQRSVQATIDSSASAEPMRPPNGIAPDSPPATLNHSRVQHRIATERKHKPAAGSAPPATALEAAQRLIAVSQRPSAGAAKPNAIAASADWRLSVADTEEAAVQELVRDVMAVESRATQTGRLIAQVQREQEMCGELRRCLQESQRAENAERAAGLQLLDERIALLSRLAASQYRIDELEELRIQALALGVSLSAKPTLLQPRLPHADTTATSAIAASPPAKPAALNTSSRSMLSPYKAVPPPDRSSASAAAVLASAAAPAPHNPPNSQPNPYFHNYALATTTATSAGSVSDSRSIAPAAQSTAHYSAAPMLQPRRPPPPSHVAAPPASAVPSRHQNAPPVAAASAALNYSSGWTTVPVTHPALSYRPQHTIAYGPYAPPYVPPHTQLNTTAPAPAPAPVAPTHNAPYYYATPQAARTLYYPPGPASSQSANQSFASTSHAPYGPHTSLAVYI